MSFDGALLYAFLLVFVRASAMLLVSPIFGAQSTPLFIRILTTLSISAALTLALKPNIAPPPPEMYPFVISIAHEVAVGLLIGTFCSFVLQAAQMAGAFLDLQMGLGISQTLNPMTGVAVTVVSQFKFFLCLVIFLSMNAHHTMFNAFAQSFHAAPSLTNLSLPAIKTDLLTLIGQMSLLSLQIAAPVACVGFLTDAALGIVNKAVPQMPAVMVGLPAKLMVSMIALAMALPVLTSSISQGLEFSTSALGHILGRN